MVHRYAAAHVGDLVQVSQPKSLPAREAIIEAFVGTAVKVRFCDDGRSRKYMRASLGLKSCIHPPVFLSDLREF